MKSLSKLIKLNIMISIKSSIYTLILIAALLAGSWACTTGNAETADDPRFADEEVVMEQNTEYERVRVSKVMEGLSNPWAVAFLPDGSTLITERPGKLLHHYDGETTELGGLPEIHSFRQGGLLDVVLHPDYESNGWIYITYSKPNNAEDTATAMARARIDANAGQLTDFEELFVQNQYSGPGRHYGSRLAWTNEGHLLMSVGDRGANPPRAQDLSDHAGSLLRFNDDGSVPDSNPFVGDENAMPEIYSYGHRNIQGLVVHPETGDIWATEHGPRGGDLLHKVQMGENHGWPVVTQGFNYRTEEPYEFTEARDMENVVDPIHEFLPTLAPSGLALVTSPAFSNWQGNLLAGGLRSERILRVKTSEQDVLHIEELFTQELGRIRDVRQGPDGHIYVLTDDSRAGLFRVEAIDR